MSVFHLDVLTAEQTMLSVDADALVATTVEGEVGILPGHVPLVALLAPGELRVTTGKEVQFLAVSGGFLQVVGHEVVVLADACERADEIDVDRAEDARRRAEAFLQAGAAEADSTVAEAALRRAIVRLGVAERYQRRRWQRSAGRDSGER
ncbi:MAG: ATP synthase F1 subunit epsilon [Dehalococcoidia bacterium]|nr:ATP synthase F1 subunit epsilon [Dehalococcoidia bacterium]